MAEERVPELISVPITRSESLGDLHKEEWEKDNLTIVIFGASGDLAKKMTYPSIFALFEGELLPKATTLVVGYARSPMTDAEFRTKIEPFLLGKNPSDKKRANAREFLTKCCVYRRGRYEENGGPEDLANVMREVETSLHTNKRQRENRMFYLALPPSQFLSAAFAVKQAGLSKTGFNRLVVEKPFGHDTESAKELGRKMGALFTEDYLYRIDHYLGKEMVQNLVVLRFANTSFEPLWNRNYISAVQVSFKEDIGTQGRGGYFDESGIIRDVIQNHLIQVFSIIAMEAPLRVAGGDYANYVRDEKVLKAVRPLRLQDVIIGQYTKSEDKPGEGGYLDDPTVPKDSITPTFATMVLYVDNARWQGVPFIVKAGKALNERRAEIRVQFKAPPAAQAMFGGAAVQIPQNELVIRLQPSEAIYMKINVKKPGLHTVPIQSELDLTYQDRYPLLELSNAYTRLLLDVLRGKQATFVRDDELLAAWEIFTPILKQLEQNKQKPIPYPFGSRGPKESDELIERVGWVHSAEYAKDWKEAKIVGKI